MPSTETAATCSSPSQGCCTPSREYQHHKMRALLALSMRHTFEVVKSGSVRYAVGKVLSPACHASEASRVSRMSTAVHRNAQATG